MKRNQKQLDNKGFSLVELIVVVAIMAILIGVMAPNLIGYIERTNVSADIQLADAVRTAVKTGMMDPAVLSNTAASAHVDWIKNTSTGQVTLNALVNHQISGAITGYGDAVAEILGESGAAAITDAWCRDKIRSAPRTAGTDMNIMVEWDAAQNDIVVTISNSDDGNGADIEVPN